MLKKKTAQKKSREFFSLSKRDYFSIKALLYSFFTGLLYLFFGGVREWHFRKWLLSTFLPFNGDETVLDICSANGHQTKNLATLFPQGMVIGVDIDPKMIYWAQIKSKKQSNVKFLCADISYLPFPPNSFDFVTSFLALHEIPTNQLRTVLQEIRRVLKPRGLFLVLDFQIPQESSFSSRLRYYFLRLFEDEAAAFFMSLPHQQLFEKFGFKVLAHHTFIQKMLFLLLLRPNK